MRRIGSSLLMVFALVPAAALAQGGEARPEEITELPPRIVLRSVQFPFGSTTVDAGSLATLELAARWMQENPHGRLRIEGHSSAPGSEDYNRALSERRALGVKRVLVDYGVDPARLEVVGRGESSPIASNDTAGGRAMNRRVEFVVVEGAEAVQKVPGPTRP